MAPSKLRRAIGAVKDQMSIGIAKASSSSLRLDLDIAIVKVTQHDEFPAEDKHVREILSLTTYSRSNIIACVNAIMRRLHRTKNWTVALKALVLIQRLLADGDPAYEQEVFFATRRGTRLLNMSHFRDTSSSNSWDFSAFVRTYALYLDEKLEYRMQRWHGKRGMSEFNKEEREGEGGCASQAAGRSSPLRERKTEHIFSEMQQLQQLLERFLGCRPTGEAKMNRVVLAALNPIVKESFQICGEMTAIISILIDRFPDLDVPNCVKVYEIFCRVQKQVDDLSRFYGWCKHAGIARTSEYPEVDVITKTKLDLMDDFIREKLEMAQRERAKGIEQKGEEIESTEPDDAAEQDMFSIKALPLPEGFDETTTKDEQEEKRGNTQPEADLLYLGSDHVACRDQGETLALALFGDVTSSVPQAAPAWEAFSETYNKPDWETALVQSASNLSNQRTTMGAGFDMLLLNGMYQHGTMSTTVVNTNFTGSASSISYGLDGRSPSMLALPPPQTSSGRVINYSADPFAPSIPIMPPTYVQMTDMERKQKLLVEEQLMWQQYARDRLPGCFGSAQPQANPYTMGGYSYGYGYQRSY